MLNSTLYSFIFHHIKSSESKVEFYLYQIELKNKLEVEYIICSQQNRLEIFNQRWEKVISNCRTPPDGIKR